MLSSLRGASTDAIMKSGRVAGVSVLMAIGMALGLATAAEAQPFAYVVGQRDPAGADAVLSVIDTATNQRVATVPLGANCRCISPDAMAIAPDMGRLYVANELANSVSVIDTASNTVVTTIAVGSGPSAVVANATGTRVYVLNGSIATSVSAIDTATNTVVATTPLPAGQARGMAITPDGARLYISTYGSNSVLAVTTASMQVTASIPVGELAGGVDVSPDGSRVYVATITSNAVYAIDTTTHATTAIPVGSAPLGVRFSPDGTRAYVTNVLSNNVSVLDARANVVIGTVAGVSQPRTLDVTPDSSRVYVAANSAVHIIDTASNTLLPATIPFVLADEGDASVITIGRAAGGDAPTAVNDSYAATANLVLSVPAAAVLANDAANGGGAMTAVLASNVSHGALTLNADGSFTYTPAQGFAGTDSFTYHASNAAGVSNVATVSLRVVSGPQPPTGLYASSIVGNTVTLRWTPPTVGDTPTSYVLEGGIARGEVLASIPMNSTSPAFTLVAPTGAFYVRVHTVSGANRSAASNEIRIFVNTPALPSAPTTLLGTVNGSTLSLAWRNTFEGGTPTALLLHVTGAQNVTLTMPVAETFTFAGVPPGTYTFRLRAANSSGVSATSQPLSLTFPGPCSGAPQPPTNVVASRDGNLITVLWDSALSGSAATGFRLNVTGSFVGSFATPQKTLSGAVGKGTYHITLHATNACGVSAPSGTRTVVVP